ncbi:hypothetical protein DFH05DRAFT_475930 [Lentinula detonsa]|uniref:Uncharacterized protein n=1 Tax=Lentinula detonsa TaxID=2804962 RepID=A0A9W8NSH9_9AGAR|nr:hypothetical protein DFH05DRAFT_475930 [Lentinula detonsa]
MPSFTRTLCVHFPREQWPGWRIAELNLRSSQPPPPPQSRESDSDSGSDSESVSPYKLRKDSTRLTVSVDPDTCTDYGSDSPVFRAFVTRDDRSRTLSSNELLSVCHPKTSIALKFALREDLVDDLVQEAQVYEGALRSLQGGVVPRCYGLFTGIGSEGQEIACLALEFWGESLTAPFKTLPIDVRYVKLYGISIVLSALLCCNIKN